MINEIEIKKDERAVLMKSGLTHWVSAETGERLQEALSRQAGHTFVKISELGITINTAQIEGVYLPDQYHNMARLKQGMWQCEYKTWHKKREECGCKAEANRRIREQMDRVREIQENKPLSEEEQESANKKREEITKELRDKGIIRGPITDQPQATCEKCSNKVPKGAKYYCSGECMIKAKNDGTLGREEELKEAANVI